MSVNKKNAMKGHFALYDTKSFRSRCKMPGCTRFSHLYCEDCKVHLCITSKRNCFYKYHHDSQPKENAACQNKQTKDSRQTIETANADANEKRSSQRPTSGIVSKRKKCILTRIATSTRAKLKSSCSHNTRSQMRAEAAKQLIIARGLESPKENFMTTIGLVAKKHATQ